MTFRLIAALAAVCVAVFAVADSLFFGALDSGARTLYNASARTLLLALVAAAAALAASRFGWTREYVGRAWTLFAVAYGVLTAGEVLRRFFTNASLASEICIVVANLAIIAAYVVTARSFKAAGLDFGGSRMKTMIATGISLVIALLLCHQSIIGGFAALRAGSFTPSDLVSPLADVVTFALVAPLLLTAFALRGGQQFWMFALLTIGTVGWMINQGTGTLFELAGGASAEALRAGRMTGFAMACIFIAAAAFTQWLAAQRTLRGVAHV